MELVMHKLIFLLAIFVSCDSAKLKRNVELAQKLEQTADSLLTRLYGDIEPNEEIFPGLNHPNHLGEDKAQHFTNEWIVHIPGGREYADFVAKDAGYENLGQVKGFEDTYRLTKKNHPRRHKRSATHLSQELVSYKNVKWAEQQFAKSRQKRSADFLEFFDRLSEFTTAALNSVRSKVVLSQTESRFNDPLWSKQWQLQDTRTKKSLPRLDLNVLPVFDMGYTGKDVNVVILDDGLEHTHPDLRENYNKLVSGDLNDEDDDPMPRYNSRPANSHGTRCAGEIAMKANNSICGVGIAYNAGIGGVRMLDGPVTDRIEGQALSYSLPNVDIYSASWGPNDDGETVEGPGRLASTALMKGVTLGRHGRGVIYVWASGNGGTKGDSCSCDGYASSIFTLSVGSASQSGAFPWYGEKCASTMAVTYSSGAYTDQKIATTDILEGCTTSHTGTSASAPMAAGIIALALEANPKLTWRDVQHLVVWTSQPGPLKDNEGWSQNAVGLDFNIRFGFGLMDAHGIVLNARNWTRVGPQRICRVPSLPIKHGHIDAKTKGKVEFESNRCAGTKDEVNFVEHIQVITTLGYSNRGLLQIDLTSPKGTKTTLLTPRKHDLSGIGFDEWPFMSVHTWGEDPKGKWTLTVKDTSGKVGHEGELISATLVLYGTKEMPAYLKNGPRVYPKEYRKRENVGPNQEKIWTPGERLDQMTNDVLRELPEF